MRRKTAVCPRCQIVHEPCSKCGRTYCTGAWPWCPHGFKSAYAGSIEPLVIFRTRDGKIRIPGSNTKRTPAGCERIEIRDIQTLAKFDRQYSEQLRSESSELRARHDAVFESYQKDRRSELRQAMQHMNPLARRLAQLAMDRNDQRRRARGEEFEGGFQVLHFDASNREAQRDSSTGWRPRQV